MLPSLALWASELSRLPDLVDIILGFLQNSVSLVTCDVMCDGCAMLSCVCTRVFS